MTPRIGFSTATGGCGDLLYTHKRNALPGVNAQTTLNGEIIVDNFAGGGGASTGMELAFGRVVDIAINHDPDAILMHKTNHPYTEHYQASVWDIYPPDVCRGRPVGLAWFSPDCKHFSKAKGSKPVEKSIRGLAWIVLRWAGTVRPRVIILENVEEFQTWGPLRAMRDQKTGRVIVNMAGRHDRGKYKPRTRIAEPGEVVPIDKQRLEANPNKRGKTFRRFVKQLRALGYDVEFRELVAADYGAPTTRKRFFMVARCDGRPIVWPEPTHAHPDSEDVKVGRKQPWRSAAEIIDWSKPMYSIFESKAEIKRKYGANAVRPLADNTMRRIIRGTDKFTIKSGKPYLVDCNHSGLGHMAGTDEPLGTITAKCTKGVCAPKLSPIETAQLMSIGQTGGGDRIQSIEQPAPTTVSKAEACLVNAKLAPITVSNTSGSVGSPVDKPVHTITTDGKQILHAAHLAQYHTEQSEMVRGQGLRAPIQTVDTANRYSLVSANLVEYFGRGKALDVSEPLHTVTSHDREALTAAHICKYYGGVIGSTADEPLPTVTAVDHNALTAAHVVKFKGPDLGHRADAPLQTVTAHANPFALCEAVIVKVEPGMDLGYWPKIRTLLNQYCGYHLADNEIILLIIDGVAYYIRDILMRMLTPRELYNAMGFPADYIIDHDYQGNEYGKSKQVARCGNAVPPPFATALARAQLPEWCNRGPIITMAELAEAVAV